VSSWLIGYLERARQPWACILFVVPLLAAYEVGLMFVSPVPDEARTGVDAWIGHAFHHFGATLPLATPIALVLGLLAWAWLLGEGRWGDPLGAWIGMVGESVLFAGLFFGLVQLAFPILAHGGGLLQDSLNRFLDVSSGRSPEMTWAMIVRFLGAGIYEEAVFRLIGFSLLRLLFLAGDLRPRWATLLAALSSSLLFAAAHHVGSGQDQINITVFLYRTLAGLYFAGLFQMRGFGIAVGAHAGYDVLVGLVLR
jgi:membrane protease YdiL (CAAX protease family)